MNDQEERGSELHHSGSLKSHIASLFLHAVLSCQTLIHYAQITVFNSSACGFCI